jgi:hypothetical protein
MSSRTLLITLVVPLSLAACSKSKDTEPAKDNATGKVASGDDATAPAKDPAPSGPWAQWDMPARHAAFQGAHVGPGGSIGTWEAWQVEGTKVRVYDGTSETTAELALYSPCEATFTVKGADGSTSGTIHHYTLENGKLVTGLGDAGSKRGNTAIACISNTVFTLDASGACLEWEQDMFKKTTYKSSPATCSFGKEGDKEVFKATVHGHETTLPIHGDAMYSDQIASAHNEPAADFAAAKAALDAKKK